MNRTYCDWCKKETKSFGLIFFGNKKYDLCLGCTKKIVAIIEDENH